MRKVKKWMLHERQPLSFVLQELGYTVRHWNEIVEQDDALRDFLDLVALIEEEELLEKIRTSKQHAVTGAIFALKARHKYIDNHRAPAPADDAKVNITVHLPAPAKSDAEFAQIIEGTAKRADVTPAKIELLPPVSSDEEFL